MSNVSKWATMPMLSVDLETTGVDAFEDRIVQAAVVRIRPGQEPQTFTWLVDPGVDIPEEASAVHGITREFAAANATASVDQMLFEMSGQIALAMGHRIPIVVANAPYDLTMIEAENRRHGIDSLASRVAPKPIGPVLDPMVIDHHVDQYRKSCYKAPGCDKETKHHECGGCRGSRAHQCGGCGSTDRTLSSLCRHYGIPLDDAHDAAADAMAAGLLVARLGSLFPQAFRGMTIGGLHQAQIGWHAKQKQGLAMFFTEIGEPEKAATCDPSWPIRPVPTTTAPVQEALL